MRRLLFVLASVIAILTFSCDTTEPDFDDSVPDVTNLTTNVSPEGSGTIEPSDGEFVEGTSIEIEAVPNTGYTFERWEGDLVGELNPTSLAMSSDRNVTAFFTETEVPLTIDIIGQGTVLEEIIDQEIEDVATVAVSTTGNSNDESDTQDDREIVKKQDSITIQPTKQPQTNIQPSRDREESRDELKRTRPEHDDRDDIEQRDGPVKQQSRASQQKVVTATVELTAEPDDGWEFSRWEGDLTGSENPDTLIVDEEKNVTAIFEEIGVEAYTLVLNEQGQGIIEAEPNRDLYDEGQEVTITAVPDDGWRFSEWQGDISGSENPQSLIMDGDKEVTSIFSMIGASEIEILQQPSDITAGTEISPAPTILITNDQDEPIEGINVSVSLNQDEFTPLSGTDVITNEDGIARFSNLVIESANTGYQIIFEANDSDISSVNSSEFNVSPAEADPSSTEADVPGGVAGGSTEIIIIVFDRFNNPISNAEDDISVSVSGANSASPTVVPGDEEGRYIADYTPENAGTDNIEIELGGVSIEGSPFTSEVITSDISSSESSVTANPDRLQAGNSSAITIELRDASGNEIDGLTNSDFSISVSGGGTAGSVSETSATGDYQFNVSNTEAEQVLVTVNASGVTLDDTPEITFTAAEPELLAIPSGSQPGTSIAGEIITNSPAVRVTDEFGNNVPDVDVDVSEQNGQEFASGTETVTTNSSGLAVFDDLVINDSGRFNLFFSARSLTATSNAFNVNPTDVDASETTAEVSNGSAGDQTDITITVRDSFGNGVDGVADDLSVSVTGANDGASVESIAEEGDGRYSTGYTPTTNGTDQIQIEFDGTEIQGSPYSSTVITSDAEVAVIQQQPGQSEAGEPISGPPSVYVTDDQDNPVEDVEVVASLEGSDSFDSGSLTVVTGVDGVAAFGDLVINTAGSYTIEFNAVGVSEDVVSESFTVVAASPDDLIRESGNNQQEVVTSELNPFTVRVVDEFENPVSGVSVDFDISDTPSGASGQELSSTSVTTGSNGQASATLTLGDVTGVYSVLASAGSAGTTTFSATASAGSAASFNFSSISTQTAGESFGITITARDSDGNTAAGYNGTADLDAASGSVSPSSVSFSNGEASVSVVLNTAGNNQSITATDGSISGTSNEFDVESGGVSADNSSVSADPGQLQAGESSELTIGLRDGSNNPVNGLSGDISIDVSGNGSAGSVSDEGNGTYTSNITNTNAQTVTVSVSVNGTTLNDEPSIQFTAANPDDIEIVDGNGQNAAVSQQLSDDFVVVVTDEFGNTVPNRTVNFSIEDTPSGASGQELSSSSPQTNAAGEASTRLTLGDTPGTYTVDASVNGAETITFSAEAQIGAASDMEIITQPGTTTAGESISPSPQVRVTDGSGNAVGGISVEASLSGASFTEGSSTTTTTGTNGIAEFSNLVTETAGTGYRMTFDAEASGVSNETSNSFEIVAAAGDPANSSADVPNGAAGEETTITITIEDEFGNSVTGAASNLSLSISGPNSGESFSSVNNNGDGMYTTSYTPQSNGTDEITIELSGSEISGSPYPSNVSTSDVSASNSSVSADPDNLQAGSSSTVTIQLQDGAGNSITGLDNSDFNINVSGDGSEGTVSNEGGGTYEFSVTNETAEQVTVTVTATGTTLDDTPQIQFAAAGPDLMLITTEPDESEAGESISGPPTVQITDEFDNPVSNISVSVTEQGGEEFTSGSDTSVDTNEDGFAVFNNVAINETGRYNLVFSSGELTPRTSNAFDVVTGSASDMTIETQPSNSTAGDAITPTPQVEVTDDSGNPVEGESITVSVQGTNFDEGTTTRSTNVSGVASFPGLIIETAGTDYTLTFNATASGVSDVTSDEFDVNAAAGDPYSTTANVPDGEVGESTTITITVEDEFGNAVEGAAGDLSVTVSGDNSETPTVSETTGGEYEASYTPTNSGTDEIAITLGGTGISDSPYTSNVNAGSASAMDINTQPGTSTAGSSIAGPPSVRVTDSENNGVADVDVEASLNGTSLTGGSSTTATTGANGVAEFPNLVTETAGTGYTLTFNADASGVDNIDSDAFEVEAADGAASNSSADVTDGAVGETTTITITVDDEFGNSVEGAAGDLSVAVSGDNSATPTVNETGGGEYEASYTPTNSGTDNIAITLNGDDISDSPYSSDVSAGSASGFNFGTIGTQTAGESFEITITAEDGSGNTSTGYNGSPTLTTTAGTVMPETANFSSGVATLNVEVSEAGNNQTITADDGTISETSNTFNVNPGAVSGSESSASAEPPSVDVGSNSTVTVNVRDGEGNAIGGLTDSDFVIEVSGSGSKDGNVSGTGTAGTYEFDVTNSTVETVTVTIQANDVELNDKPEIEFTAAEPTGMQIINQPEETTAGQSIRGSPTVKVINDAGNPVEGVDVTVSEQGDYEFDEGVTTKETDESGEATFNDLLINEAGTYSLVFSLDGLDNEVSDSFDVTPAGVSASGSAVEATSPHDADGTDASTVTITLQDSFGNEISGLGPGDFTVDVEDASNEPVSETSTDGTYAFEVTHDTAEEIMVQITADGVPLEDTPTIVFEATVPPEMTITEQPGDTEAGELIDPAPMVRLLDAGGDPVSGVDITANLSSNSFSGTSDATVSTDGSGNAVFDNLAIETATDEYTITFEADDPDVADKTSDEFDVIAVAPASVSTSVETGTAAADGSDELEFLVTVEDDFENPVSGVTVDASDDGTAITYTGDGDSQETDGSGQVTFTASSATAQPNVTFTFTEQENGIEDSVQGNFEAGSASASESGIEAVPSGGLTADGSDASELTITVRDGGGNELDDEEVFFSITSGNGVLSSGPWTTNASGEASASLTSTQKNTVTVTGYLGDDDSGEAVGIVEVEFESVAADAGQSAISADPISIPADGTSTSTVTVQLRDADGNPLTSGGDNVVLSTTAGTLLNSISDNADGTYSQELESSDSAETATVTGTLDDVEIGTVDVEFEAPQASQMEIITQPENTRAGQPISPSPQVLITDDSENPVDGISVTVSEEDGYTFDSGTLEQSTNSDGIAIFDDLVIQSSGRYALVFDASASGVANVTSDPFIVNPGIADAEMSTIEVPDGTAGEETEIKILIKDEFGNSVNVTESDLSVLVSGDNTASPAIFSTEEDGEYDTSYTPINSGDDTVSATLNSAKLSNSPQFSKVSASSE